MSLGSVWFGMIKLTGTDYPSVGQRTLMSVGDIQVPLSARRTTRTTIKGRFSRADYPMSRYRQMLLYKMFAAAGRNANS